MTIDADGAPRAYHPTSSRGLDDLANAGRPGRWWALATDTGQPSGSPVIQSATDPAPGFYVSMTSLQDPSGSPRDPDTYVDAERVPYVALPSRATEWGARLGDLALVAFKGRVRWSVFADVGNNTHIGEGSIALASALGISGSPRRGGVSSGVVYILFPGTSRAWPQALTELEERGQAVAASLGRVDRLISCAKGP
jgi:hypothetical protein